METIKWVYISFFGVFLSFIPYFLFDYNILSIIVFITNDMLREFTYNIKAILFYLFVFINLLIPYMIFLCILAYRSKPTKESFKQLFDEIFEFIPKISSSKPINKNEEKNSLSYFGNWSQSVLNFFLIKNIKNKINYFCYDAGICQIVWLKEPDNNDSHIILGIFGTWIPIK